MGTASTLVTSKPVTSLLMCKTTIPKNGWFEIRLFIFHYISNQYLFYWYFKSGSKMADFGSNYRIGGVATLVLVWDLLAPWSEEQWNLLCRASGSGWETRKRNIMRVEEKAWNKHIFLKAVQVWVQEDTKDAVSLNQKTMALDFCFTGTFFLSQGSSVSSMVRCRILSFICYSYSWNSGAAILWTFVQSVTITSWVVEPRACWILQTDPFWDSTVFMFDHVKS